MVSNNQVAPTPTPVEKKRRFVSAAVQVVLFVSAESLPDHWDDLLFETKVVGVICETGTQINGPYIVLYYNNFVDCMEFIKHDKEALLEALEAL